MTLSLEKLASLVHGAYGITKKNGMLSFSRFDEKQFAVVDRLGDTIVNAARTNSAVTVELVTDAEHIAFDCAIPPSVGERDTLDVWCDDKPVECFDVDGLPPVSRLECSFPAGNKRVTVYLPCDASVEIGRFELDGSFADKSNRGERVMFIGDSITQGYGPHMSSMTYVNCFARLSGCDVFDQGIGGYYYDENFVIPLDAQKPDRIIVAMGTNQISSVDKVERIHAFYEALDAVYPDVNKLAVTPIWRDAPSDTMKELVELSGEVRKTCEKYGIPVIDGLELVPHSNKFFKDGLHPNAAGCMLYALNLYKKYSSSD